MAKKIMILMLSFIYNYSSNAETIKDFGKQPMNNNVSADVNKLNKCEKQKKCTAYIDMTSYKEATFVVEMPKDLFYSFKNQIGIQSLYWGEMMMAKENPLEALKSFTNNKQIYVNAINSGLETPQSRIFIRINTYRIADMNTILLKNKDNILATYTFVNSEK